MRKVLFIVVMVLIYFSSQGFAATLISDNFDSYTPGNIPPTPWSVNELDGSIRVVNSPSSSSPNSVALTAGSIDSGSPSFAQSHANISNQGIYEAYLRTNNVNNETLVMFTVGNGSGSQLGPSISLGGPACCGIPQGHLASWDGSSWTDVMAISNNTWYHIKFVVDVPSKKFDIYVDDMTTPVVTGANFHDPTSTVLFAVGFIVYEFIVNPNPPTPDVDFAYVDNVLVTDATPVPTMNEWGMFIFVLFAGTGAVYFLRRQKAKG